MCAYYTYISEKWNTTSWLVIASNYVHSSVSKIVILYDMRDEDHIPFNEYINSDKIPNLTSSNSNDRT